MKIRVELSVLLVLGFLFCGLALLEFPELLTLTDDMSNSFTLESVASHPEAPSVATERAPVVVASAGMGRPGHPQLFRSAERPLSSAAPVNETLHIFCILQT